MSDNWLDSSTYAYNPQKGNTWSEKYKGKLFDSYLGKSSHPTQNHVLKFFLRIHLKPVTKQTSAKDSNKNSYPVKEWTPGEWSKFKSQFIQQSNLWNNRFWLVPPKSFSLMDVQNGGKKVRPNVMCRLITEIAESPMNAHRTIDVVNLDVDALRKMGKTGIGSGTFRSNDKLYDSLDVNKRDNHYEDDRGVEHTIKNYYTIAHELGHAIGLPHVGVIKGRPQCKFAVTLKSMGIKNVSSHLKKGSNSEVCYGEHDTPGLAENIMGLGTKFEDFNAKPWVDRAAMHTNTIAAQWKVVLNMIAPQSVI
jgi:hypothetical protein